MEDGLLVGRGIEGIVPILHSAKEYTNFHLRAEVSLSDGGHCGICYRSPFVREFPDAYSFQINVNHPLPQKTGSLNGIAPVAKVTHKNDEWVTLEIIADGDKLIHKVNGQTVVDVKDSRFTQGHITLWLSKDMALKVRKMEIRELPADQVRAVAEWVLDQGGQLEIAEGDRISKVNAKANLPTGPFAVYMVVLPENPNILNDDLARLRGLKRLSYIFICNTSVTDAGLVHLQNLQSLTFVSLAQSKVTDAGLVNLKDLVNLRLLNVQQTAVTPAGLAVLKELPNLVVLQVGGPTMTDADLLAISQWDRLVELVAEKSPQITDSGTADLSKLLKLGTLNLNNSQVTDVTLERVKSLKRLNQLHLAETKITDDGLRHLVELPELADLVVRHTAITDAGLAHLIRCQKLQSLVLSGTAVTDDSVDSLSQLKALTNLNLQQTLISETGYKKLQTALPECKIEWDKVKHK